MPLNNGRMNLATPQVAHYHLRQELGKALAKIRDIAEEEAEEFLRNFKGQNFTYKDFLEHEMPRRLEWDVPELMFLVGALARCLEINDAYIQRVFRDVSYIGYKRARKQETLEINREHTVREISMYLDYDLISERNIE